MKDNLVNYYSSAIENCYSTIGINYKQLNNNYDYYNEVVGINCFDELLLRSEFISYARENFNHQIKRENLWFFSKRLNLYVIKYDHYAYIYSLKDD
jgi:hypothetical protein